MVWSGAQCSGRADDACPVAELIVVEEHVFNRPSAQNGDLSYDVHEGMSYLAGEQRAIVERAMELLRQGTVRLPSLPDTATRLIGLVSQPELSLKDLEGAVRDEPLLVARIIRVANSPFYRGASEIASLRQAIAMLGLDSVRSIVMQAVVESSVFKGLRAQELANEQRHAVVTAHFAQMVGELAGVSKTDAFLAGILHDVGRIVLPGLWDSLGVSTADLDRCRQLSAMCRRRHGAFPWQRNMPWVGTMILAMPPCRLRSRRAYKPWLQAKVWPCSWGCKPTNRLCSTALLRRKTPCLACWGSTPTRSRRFVNVRRQRSGSCRCPACTPSRRSARQPLGLRMVALRARARTRVRAKRRVFFGAW